MDDALQNLALASRAALTSGALGGAALLALLRSVPFCDRDVWVDTLLGLEEPPPDSPELPRGAVPYLPCGVEEILEMVLKVPLRPDDVLVDLGSGLGRVVMLAHLLSGARACGIEIQEPLVRAARSRCAELALDAVTFLHADAAEAALDGSVFFLYSPFGGATLTRVISQLAEVSLRKPIVVCAAGLELRGVPWLVSRPTESPLLTLYDSSVPGVPPRSAAPGRLRL